VAPSWKTAQIKDEWIRLSLAWPELLYQRWQVRGLIDDAKINSNSKSS